jgi:hypothetical protein
MVKDEYLKRQLQATLERHQGRRNAITRRELRQILEIPNSQDRQLRLLIADLRHEGIPILMNTQPPAGYYLPESLVELKEGMNNMRQYIIQECLILRDLKVKGNQYLFGQTQGKLI